MSDKSGYAATERTIATPHRNSCQTHRGDQDESLARRHNPLAAVRLVNQRSTAKREVYSISVRIVFDRHLYIVVPLCCGGFEIQRLHIMYKDV